MYKLPPVNSPEWCGHPVQLLPHQINDEYMQRINALLVNCLSIHSRWSVFRIDLRVPNGKFLPLGAITAFIESMKSQLMHVELMRRDEGKRVYDHMLRYVWVREYNGSMHPHYHIALLLNRDAYFSLGDYSQLQSRDCGYDSMLAGRICKAWGVALGLDWTVAMSGVHFPDRPVSPLQIQNEDYEKQFSGVLYRLSYFAKYETKINGDGQRNFGMSQLRYI